MNEVAAGVVFSSNSKFPDLDWSQVSETVRLLNLAVAQIEDSMRAGDESVDALTDSFTSMAGIIQVINAAIDELPDSVSEEITQSIGGKCDTLHKNIQQAIIAFQFYDRLIQKLTHVSNSMDALGNLIGNKMKLYNPAEWLGLQDTIRARYTMESERLMFDAFMNGASITEALAVARDHDNDLKNNHGDIDLF